MNSNKKIARTAGVLYLLMIVTFMFSLGYAPSRFLIERDPVATINAIESAEWMFRLAIVVGMFACVIYTLQVLALSKLLSPVNKDMAIVFVALSLAHLPLFFIGYMHELELLSLLDASTKGVTSDGGVSLQARVASVTSSYHDSVRLNMIFMSLWLIPFGYLVFKSNFLPRILGILLILNAVPYLLSFFRVILAPGYEFPAFVEYATAPMMIGEFATCLWLLIMGAKEPPATTASTRVLATSPS